MTWPVGGREPGVWPGPIADDLLRVVLHDRQGSLPRYGLRERAGAARRLDVALRAALFCDLARAGLLTGTHGPEAGTGPAPASLDPVPAADGGAAGADGGATDDGGAGDTEARDASAADASAGEAHAASDAGTRTGVAQDRILAAVLAAVSRRPGVAWARWFRHVRDDRSALVSRLVVSGRWTPQGGYRFLDADPRGAERLQAAAFTVSELIQAPADERDAVLGYLYALTGTGMSAEHVQGWHVRLARLEATASGATVRAVLAAARSVNRRRRFGRR